MSTQSHTRRIFNVLEKTDDVYGPREDTFLMLEVLEKLDLHRKSVMDVGTGSGILALFCALQGACVMASDISDAALRATRNAATKLGVHIEIVRSNLLSSIREKFDLVVFNPPYLVPDRAIQDPAVDGGSEGTATIKRFLRELSQCLKTTGYCLLLLNSISHPNALIREFPQFTFEHLISRKLFFEELFVFRVSRS